MWRERIRGPRVAACGRPLGWLADRFHTPHITQRDGAGISAQDVRYTTIRLNLWTAGVRRQDGADLLPAGHGVGGREEAHHDVGASAGGLARLLWNSCSRPGAGRALAAARSTYRPPGRRVACGKAKPRHLERLLRLADDLAVDQQDRLAPLSRLAGDVHVLEVELAQVDRQADRGKQRRGLRQDNVPPRCARR